MGIGRGLAFCGSSNGKSPGHLPVSIMLITVPNASPPLDLDIHLFLEVPSQFQKFPLLA